jgi:hypothetical protein
MSKVSRETVVPPPTPRETNLANRSRWESAYGRADAELTRRRADFRFLHRGEKMTEPAIY